MLDITEYINNDFKAIDSLDAIETVKDFFAEIHFSHFPVVEEGIYIGSIASDDVDAFDSDKKIIDYRYALGGFFARSSMFEPSVSNTCLDSLDPSCKKIDS